MKNLEINEQYKNIEKALFKFFSNLFNSSSLFIQFVRKLST